MNSNFYLCLARAEAVASALQAEQVETLQKAYDAACEQKDTDSAASFARQIRNKLLDESDKEMTLDRLGFDTSTATKFIASLTKLFSGAWAVYRQALRDIPQQEGFPFNIEFPEKPND